MDPASMVIVADSTIADSSMDYQSKNLQTPTPQTISKLSRNKTISKLSRNKKQKIRTGSGTHSKMVRTFRNSPGAETPAVAAHHVPAPAPQLQTPTITEEVESMQIQPDLYTFPEYMETLANTL